MVKFKVNGGFFLIWTTTPWTLPLYPFFMEKYTRVAYKVVGDRYIKEDNGTGIVHQAPAFGEDDYRVCLEHGIINKLEEPPCPLASNGHFTGEVDFVKGLFFKEADKVIIKNLKERGHVWDEYIIKKKLMHFSQLCTSYCIIS